MVVAGGRPIEQPEMALEDLQRLRFALDRALQPVPAFEGFECLDQFQTAAVRYQLNFLAYGVAMTQARFAPAMRGYLQQAQIKLLEKQAQHRVWRYWQLENAWGNLRWDANPVQRENIMFTGFVALQMVMLQASTGCTDFVDSARWQLQHPKGMRYAFSAEDLMQRLQQEFLRTDLRLIACEPNWIYPLCNAIGASALLGHEHLQQRQTWAQHASAWRQALETEFLHPSGFYVPCRSHYTGLALPMMGGAMPLALPCFFLHACAPDLALRQWLLLRRRVLDAQGHVQRSAFWRMDTGNYGFSRASAFTSTALAAAELGDSAVRDACLQALDEECPAVLHQGVRHRARASVWSHGVELMARAAHPGGFQALLQQRPSAGMHVAQADYPEVLVAAAHAKTDRLDVVLYPGGREGVHTVTVGGLQPGRQYDVQGAQMECGVADAKGQLRVPVVLQGRTPLAIFNGGG